MPDSSPRASGDSSATLVSGVRQDLTVNFSPLAEHDIYFIIGSISGFSPYGSHGGTVIPLVRDVCTKFMLSRSSFSIFVNTVGILNGNETATEAFDLPPGLPPFLADRLVHNAALRFDGISGGLIEASNPVAFANYP